VNVGTARATGIALARHGPLLGPLLAAYFSRDVQVETLNLAILVFQLGDPV
jgi:hypothetical protein